MSGAHHTANPVIPPVVQGNFAASPADFSTLSTLSSMPTGGGVTRAGNAMLYDSTGKLAYAPNNVITYSEQFDNAAWTKAQTTVTANSVAAPDGNTTADIMVETVATGQHNVQRGITSIGKNILSVYAKQGPGTRLFRLVNYNATDGAQSETYFNLTNGTVSSGTGTISSVGNGWYRCSIVATNTVTSTIFISLAQNTTIYDYTGDGTSGIYIWGAQLEAVTYQTTPSSYVATTASAYYGPRFDYNPSTLAAKGLLIEGSRTNLLAYSEDCSQWLSSTTLTVTTKQSTAPDGTSNANKYLEISGTSLHAQDGPGFTFVTSTFYTYSVYVQSINGRNFEIGFPSTIFTARFAKFTLSGAGSVYSTDSGITASIQNIGNGWYRCSATSLCVSGASSRVGNFVNDASYSRNYAGDTSKGIFIWGAQLEAGSFPTSYIPTAASTVTRAAETFTMSGYTNRLIEAYYIDQETNVSSSIPETVVSSGFVTISPPTFGWVTSLRTYSNAYAGDVDVPSWLDNSGTTGNRMVTDSTGTLTWAPSNMLLNSATLSTQTVTVTSGATNILSFSGTGSITYSGAASGTLTGTGANNRVFVVLTMSSTSLTLTVSGSVTSAQLERVTYQTAPRAYIPTTSAAVYMPRFDYDASTTPATPRGMLIEESRTNLVTFSQEMTNAAWFYGTQTVGTANAAIAPDGTNTAVKVAASSTNTVHTIISTSAIVTAGTVVTATVYAKAAEYSSVTLQISNSTYSNAARIAFNVANGTHIATATNGSPTVSKTSITDVGNGWYRLSVTGVVDSSTTNIYFTCGVMQNTSTYSYIGDGVSGAFFWGAQLEAGSFATSYIPTVASSVTRVADVLKNTSISSWFNVSAGSAMVEYNIPNALATSAAARLVDFSDGTTSNWHSMWVGQPIGKAASQSTFLSGTNQGRIDVTPAFTAGQTARVGFTYKVNYRAIAVNGTTPVTSTVLSSLPSTTRFGLGSNYNGLEQINGWIRSFAYYNQSLPDAILRSKSSVGGPY